jgi:hypothetical protein
MFCPNCASEILSSAMEYCSNCGLNCSDVRAVIDGERVETRGPGKGIRQGVKMILLALVLLPLFILVNSMFPPNDRLIESSPSNTWFEQIGWAVLWTVALAGVLRIAYAFLFERSKVLVAEKESGAHEIIGPREARMLPPQREVPAGQWKTSGELFEPVFAKRKVSSDLG